MYMCICNLAQNLRERKDNLRFYAVKQGSSGCLWLSGMGEKNFELIGPPPPGFVDKVKSEYIKSCG